VCLCASTKFEEICKDLHHGTILISDLKIIKRNDSSFRKLCEAVSVTVAAGFETKHKTQKLTQKDIISCLNQRLDELKMFLIRKNGYKAVCEWVKDHQKIRGEF